MEKVNILVIGGTGFIGRTLSKFLFDEGYEVAVLSRRPPPDSFLNKNITYIQADVMIPGRWQEMVPDFDVLINLAGMSIFRRWTVRGKQEIIDSRITATNNIIDTVRKNRGKVQQFFSVSGVGYYGFHGDEILDEDSPAGSDFLAQVAAQWEDATGQLRELGVRTVICRFGHVLGKHGGVLPKLVTLAKWHLASRWGSGNQWTSWIHEEDLTGCILFLLKNSDLSGPVNITSPNPVRNRELMYLLSEITGRHVLVPPIPGCVLRLITGEFALVFLNGQRVMPEKLINQGFHFKYPELQGALEALFNS